MQGVNQAPTQEDDVGTFHNLYPLFWIIGKCNESKVIVDDEEVWVLIELRAQMSTIILTQAKRMGLGIHTLETILKIEGTGGGKVPYKGYVEIHL